MPRAIHAVRTALAIVAAASAVGGITSRADAQRATPRYGVGVDPDAARRIPPARPVPAHSGGHFDARRQVSRRPADRVEPSVVYVVPGYGYPQGAYGVMGSVGGVYDTNGRPLSAGYEYGPSLDAVPSYTPDLGGTPYVVIEGGAMMLDLPSGERRTFPSCAAQSASHDPDGRPRTVFYDSSTGGVILHVGQHGRVVGSPVGASCYGVDSYGRIALH